MSRLKGADLGVALPSGTMNYRGAYAGGTAYATNDVVTSGGLLWLALAPSNGVTPTTAATAVASSQVTGSTQNVGTSNVAVAQSFTPNTNLTIDRVTVTFLTVPSATQRIGITTAITDASTPVAVASQPWVGGNAYADLPAASIASGVPVTVLLPNPITLTSGTQYAVVVAGTAAGGLEVATTVSDSGITHGTVHYGASGNYTSGGIPAAYGCPFSFGYASPWTPIPPVVPTSPLNFRDTWAVLSSYSRNDVVTRYGMPYVATEPVAAGVDPAVAAAPTTLASSLSAAASVVNAGTNIVAQEITIGAAACNGVDTLTLRFNAQPGTTGTVRLGIASAFTETTGVQAGAVPWLTTSAGVAAYVEIPCAQIAAGQDVVVTLPGTVNLTASTAYNLVAVNTQTTGMTGSNQGVNGLGVGSANTLTNVTNQNELLGASGGTGGVNQANTSNGSGFTWIYRIQSSGSPWRRLGLLVESVYTNAAVGATLTLPDVSLVTMHRLTLTANTTITLPTPGAGKSFTVGLVQDATGGRTVAWATPSGVVKWPGGTVPTITATANAIDVVSFECLDGTNWLGVVVGQAFA